MASAARTEIVLTVDGPSADADVAGAGTETTDEELRKQAAALKGPSEAALALFAPHDVDLGSDAEVKEAGTVNPHFKLLMRLVGWESSEGIAAPPKYEGEAKLTRTACPALDSGQLVWVVPAPLPPSKLDSDIKIINDFLLDPVDPQSGKSASELLRKQRKKPVRRKRRIASDVESGVELEFEKDGEPVVKQKAKKKRQKKREEEEAAYKSAQFVRSSTSFPRRHSSRQELMRARFPRFTTRTTRRTQTAMLRSSPARQPCVIASPRIATSVKLTGTIYSQLREKLNANAISVHLDSGSKKRKEPRASGAAGTPSVAASSSPVAGKSRGKKPKAGRAGKGKKAKKTKFDAAILSDLDDEEDNALMDDLREKADRLRGATDADPAADASSPRAMSTPDAASDQSSPAPPDRSAATAVRSMSSDSDDGDTTAPAAASQPAKRRRVVADSDDDD